MTGIPHRHPLTLERFIRCLPGMDDVTVTRDLAYSDDDAGLRIDVYHPLEADGSRPHPAVVLATGYPDVGVPLRLGCVFKDMEMSSSWARLIAASGMAAVTYTTRQPASDIRRVLDYLSAGTALNLDPVRIGLWAMSGHGPVALSALMPAGPSVRAAVLSQAFTLDLDGSGVAEAAGTYGFADACAGRSLDDLAADVPLLIVRAGRDEFAGLNAALDRFVAAALARNLPLTMINHHRAAHAFELRDDHADSSSIVDEMLAFMRRHLMR